ncbi:glycosyltransferase [Elusimicrobiota bacterium]
MLETLLWAAAGLWVFFLVQLLVNTLLVRPLPKVGPGTPDDCPTVSIVSPARDEERGIRAAVSSFCRQDYPKLEVIVVDDCSTDSTPRILSELQTEFPMLKVVRGKEPQSGWLGKPNALEVGRQAAKGDWLIFADADVVYAPDLVSRSVAYAEREKAGMLCLWPEALSEGVLEAAIMSMFGLLFALTPAFLVSRPRWKRFAAGGGVFNMVRREALEACGAFECLKDEVVDDVGLGFKVKAAGQKLALALPRGLIRIRIYQGAREAVEGFTKNIYPAMRRVPWAAPLLFACGLTIHILPYAAFLYSLALGELHVPALIALVLMHLVLAGCAVVFRMPWYTVFLTPVREALWSWIALRSFLAYRRRGILWRGRAYGSMD